MRAVLVQSAVAERRYALIEKADELITLTNRIPLASSRFRSVEIVETAEALSEDFSHYGLPEENRSRTVALLDRLEGLTLTLTQSDKRLAPYLNTIRVPERCQELRSLLGTHGKECDDSPS